MCPPCLFTAKREALKPSRKVGALLDNQDELTKSAQKRTIVFRSNVPQQYEGLIQEANPPSEIGFESSSQLPMVDPIKCLRPIQIDPRGLLVVFCPI